MPGFEEFGRARGEDKNNIQPRVGAVYDLNGNGKDIIRAGWGVYYDFGYTNANIQLLGKKAKLLIWPIATLLRVNDITKSPVNWLYAQIQLGGGKIGVNRFALQSEAFEAHAHGDIPIADVLDQSPLNLPVEFSLRRSLA